MAGFSLRGGGGGGGGGGASRPGSDRGGDHHHPIGADSLFLYARGAAAAAADTAAGGGGSGGGIGFQLWHPHHQAQAVPHTSQFFSSASGGVATGVVLGFSPHDAAHGAGVGGVGAGGGRAGTSCQDCGNNAKKDCTHQRCRTCCRSRGFSCATHVKSTWVPASKRRERQQQLAALFRGAAAANNNSSAAAAAAVAAAANKRPRELVRSLGRLPSTSTAIVDTTTSSGEGEGRFPAELSLEAVFRCVRIGAVDEPEAEFAYQTAVSIGGHTFKGILRDHGPAAEDQEQLPPGEYGHHHHQLTGGGREEGSSPAGSSEAHGGGASTAATSAAVLMDPYPTPIGAFAAGTQFFPHNPRT